MQDYVNDMYREATLEEFIEIYKSAFRFYSRINPEWRLEILTKTNGHPERIEWVLNSQDFESLLKSEYDAKLRHCLASRKVFTFIDCLEEYTDLMYYGDPLKVPSNSVHIPSETAMITFPKFVRQVDKPQPLNSLKFGPHDFLNPIKATLMDGPQYTPEIRKPIKPFRKKYRRMAGNAMRRNRYFSTLVGQVCHQLNHPLVYTSFVPKP
uniref:Uncharacterized protein n=1 Tax=Euplotes harpa TaxID=151035 RepID=A0A7S3N6F8_9SPIT|mmetsp:Transcript_16395/g.18941  ORF Transcript_16395/g.18941 Transcript_16395/m.18941 type:complete len:209 (+) Transcript_16395:3-629(+)